MLKARRLLKPNKEVKHMGKNEIAFVTMEVKKKIKGTNWKVGEKRLLDRFDPRIVKLLKKKKLEEVKS